MNDSLNLANIYKSQGTKR